MPTKIKEDKNNQNVPILYEKITKKKIGLSPSAWVVFQDYIKRNLGKEKVINNDIIWFGIAVGCIIGVIYFVFGGLQPLILRNYINNAKQNINEVGQTFVNQVNGLSILQENVVKNTTYNLLADCSEAQKYTTLVQDLQNLENVERSLFANPKFKEIPKFKGFGERSIRLEYAQFFDYYTVSLENLKNTVLEDSKDLILFANYRNFLIEGCMMISKDSSRTQRIIDFCVELPNKSKEYHTNHNPSFWSDLQPLIEENQSICNRIVEGRVNFLEWQISWLSSYGKLTAFVPNIQKNVSILENAVIDMQKESLRYKNELNRIYERKTSFLGMWYLLEF